ncbi:MAG: hypothetical protein AAF959_07640 [Cyanobacteria bacterium P01_D01_bin.56]
MALSQLLKQIVIPAVVIAAIEKINKDERLNLNLKELMSEVPDLDRQEASLYLNKYKEESKPVSGQVHSNVLAQVDKARSILMGCDEDTWNDRVQAAIDELTIDGQ